MSSDLTIVPVRKGYAEGRFGQIHYRMAQPDGDLVSNSAARPLVCFHMSPYASIIYETFLAEMGRDRIAIAMDTPGFGDSDPPSAPPTISEYAGAAIDLMGALGLTSVDLMGYHTGSKIALETTLQNPDRVHRLVLVSAPLWTPKELAQIKAKHGPEQLTKDGAHAQASWQSAVRWSMPGRSLDDIGKVFWAKLLNPAISWWGHNAAFAYDSAAAFPKIKQPILILNPEDDVWEMTPRAKSLLKHSESRIHDLPGWSHGFLDLKTQETAAIVRGFLDRA
jgi:pimeloyl-ACP methyl ester carboxylesterase